MKSETTESLQKVSRIEVHTNTIEDYRHKLLSPLKSDLNGNDLFKVVEFGSAKSHHQELITVNDESELIHYYPDQTTHGWNHSILPFAATRISKIVVSATKDESIHGFFLETTSQQLSKVITMSCNEKKEWDRIDMPREISMLFEKVVSLERFTDHQQRDHIYGVSVKGPAFSAFILTLKEGQWIISYQTELKRGDKVFLVDGFNSFDFTLIRINYQRKYHFRFGNNNNGNISFTREKPFPSEAISENEDNEEPLTNDFIDIYPILSKRNNGIAPERFSMVNKSRGLLHQLTFDSQLNVESLFLNLVGGPNWSPVSIGDVTCGTDSKGFPVILAHNHKKDKTFMLNSNELLGGIPVMNKRWFLLGENLKNFAIPFHLVNGFEAFIVQQDGSLVHTVKDEIDQSYHNQVIASPHESKDTVKAPSHCIEVIAFTKKELGAPARPFQVRASRPCVCWVNDKMVRLGTSSPVNVLTAVSGHTTIKFPANSISVPSVELHFPDFMEEGEFHKVSADKSLHERMAGNDPLYKVDIQTMHEHGLMPDPKQLGPDKSAEIQTAVNRFANALLKTHGEDVLLSDHDPIGWEFDFKPGSGHPMTVKRMNEAEMASAFSESALSINNDTFGIADWLGEALRHIGHSIEQVGKVVVRFVNNVMEMVVHLVDDVTKLILKGAEIVAKAFETLVQGILKAYDMLVDIAKSFVNWLMQQFGWEDVLNTYHVMKHSMSQGLDNMEKMFAEQNQNYVKEQFDKVHNQMEQTFTQAQNAFKPGGMFADKPSMRHLYDENHGSGKNSEDPLLNSPFKQVYKSSNHQIAFVANQLMKHAPDVSSMMLSSSLSQENKDFVESFKVFIKRITDALERHDMREKADEISNYFHQNFDSPAEFLESGLSVLLDITKEIALLSIEILEDVILLLMDLLRKAVSAINTLLNAPIEIPLITDLFRIMVADENAKMSMLDIAALTMAVPATLVYKIMKDGKAPFTEEQRKRFVGINLPLGDLRTMIEGPSNLGENTDHEWLRNNEELFQYLAAVTLVPYTIIDISLDIDSATRVGTVGTEHPAVYVVSLLAFGNSAAFQTLSFPYGVFLSNDRKTGDWVGFGLWVGGLIPLMFDGIVLIAGLFTKSAPNVRSMPGAGPLVSFILGGVFGVGGAVAWIGASIADNKFYGWDITEELLLNIPVASELSIYIALEPKLKPVVMGGLAIVDMIGNIGGCLAHVSSTANG